MGVIFEILHAPILVARIHQVARIGLCRAVAMHIFLRERIFVTTPIGGVVLEQNLIVVVAARCVAIYAVGYGQVVLIVGAFSEARTKRYAVEATATVAMFEALAAMLDHGLVVGQHGVEKDSCHHTVALGIHIHSVNLIDIEDGDIEAVLETLCYTLLLQDTLADRVVFVFERAIETTIFVVKLDTAEVCLAGRF